MFKDKIELRLVGIVGKPHGIRGEVILSFLTDYPDSISTGVIFYSDEKKQDIFEVESIRNIDVRSKNGAIVKFKGIDDRTFAEKIKGLRLLRESDNSPSLSEGKYWVDDLIGCGVYNNQYYIGKVIDVLQNPANDNILVKKDKDCLEISGIKENEFYIPLIEDYISKIDIEGKKIFLKKNPEYI